MNYEKPLPQVTEEARPFWEACKQHRLIIQHCKDCGHRQFYPRVICANCSSWNLDWIEASGKGVVYSFTIVYRAPSPGFQTDVPYVLSLIDLDEGIRMMSHVIGCKPEDVRVGMPVMVEFDDVTEEISLPKFKLLA